MFDFSLEDSSLQVTHLYGKEVKEMIDVSIKQRIVDHLARTYQIKMHCTNKYFKAMEINHDMTLLKKYKHLIYVNTNHSVSLLCLVRFQQQATCLYIDKNHVSMYLLKCQFSQSLYDGTVFEGEVVDTYLNDHIFLISDFLVYKGTDLHAITLEHRLSLLGSIITPPNYQPDTYLEPFQIAQKDFIDYTHLESFVTVQLPLLPYRDKITGLIFRPTTHSNKHLIYHFGKDFRQTYLQPPSKPKLKLKLPPTSQTVDQSTSKRTIDPVAISKAKIDVERHTQVKFLLYETGNPDDYLLKLKAPDGTLVPQGYALINDMKTSQLFQQWLNERPYQIKKDGLCVLCTFHPTFKKWKPLRILDGESADNLLDLI